MVNFWAEALTCSIFAQMRVVVPTFLLFFVNFFTLLRVLCTFLVKILCLLWSKLDKNWVPRKKCRKKNKCLTVFGKIDVCVCMYMEIASRLDVRYIEAVGF